MSEAEADAAAMGRALVAAHMSDRRQPDARGVDLVQSLHAEAWTAIANLEECNCADRDEAEAAVLTSLSRYGMNLGCVFQIAAGNIRSAQKAGMTFARIDEALSSPYLLPTMGPDE